MRYMARSYGECGCYKLWEVSGPSLKVITSTDFVGTVGCSHEKEGEVKLFKFIGIQVSDYRKYLVFHESENYRVQ